MGLVQSNHLSFNDDTTVLNEDVSNDSKRNTTGRTDNDNHHINDTNKNHNVDESSLFQMSSSTSSSRMMIQPTIVTKSSNHHRQLGFFRRFHHPAPVRTCHKQLRYCNNFYSGYNRQHHIALNPSRQLSRITTVTTPTESSSSAIQTADGMIIQSQQREAHHNVMSEATTTITTSRRSIYSDKTNQANCKETVIYNDSGFTTRMKRTNASTVPLTRLCKQKHVEEDNVVTSGTSSSSSSASFSSDSNGNQATSQKGQPIQDELFRQPLLVGDFDRCQQNESCVADYFVEECNDDEVVTPSTNEIQQNDVDEIEEKEAEFDYLKRLYDKRTWDMYDRINRIRKQQQRERPYLQLYSIAQQQEQQQQQQHEQIHNVQQLTENEEHHPHHEMIFGDLE